MKRSLVAVCSFVVLSSWALAFDHSHAAFTSLLQKHVAPAGVDYKDFKKDQAPLKAYLGDLAKVKESEFSSWSVGERLAFLINLYNATTINVVLEHYPIRSFKSEVGGKDGPWKLKTVSVFGKTVSLDDLEHKMIRQKFNEPRIHFALNCASDGCPALRAEAFKSANLSRQLGEQTVGFLADSSKNKVTPNKIQLSPIFDWFKEDFVKRSGSVKAFLNPYYKSFDVTKSKANITYTNYGWSLNDAS